MVGEKDSVLVEGIISGETVKVDNFRDLFKRKDLSDELMIQAIDQCRKANDIYTVFNLVKKAGELSDQVNIKLATLINEKAWPSFAEEFVNTEGVCKEAKEIARGGIWKFERGRHVPPARFGLRPGEKRPERREKVRY